MAWTQPFLKAPHVEDKRLSPFVDGRQVLEQPVRANPAVQDRSQLTLRLTKGMHRVLVALDTDHGKGQGIFLRFIHPGESREKQGVSERGVRGRRSCSDGATYREPVMSSPGA